MVITKEDWQELGRLLKKGKSCRPMTEKEIEDFHIVPEGAVFYPDIESYREACTELKDTHIETGGNHPKTGQFWIKRR